MTEQVSLSIRYFAHAKSHCGCDTETLHFQQHTDEASIKAVIAAAHPGMDSLLTSCRLAHNQRFIRGPVVLHVDDELALIPPVSGG